jgi:hypothetical protein
MIVFLFYTFQYYIHLQAFVIYYIFYDSNLWFPSLLWDAFPLPQQDHSSHATYRNVG